MTSTDDLVRELRSQAETIATWPEPALPRLSPPERRPRPVVLVLASVAAVVATVLTVPHLVEGPPRAVPVPPAGSPTAGANVSADPDQDWQAGEVQQRARGL